MFSVWTAVIVSNPEAEHAGKAGVVHATNAEKHPDAVVVKFDEGTITEVSTKDLKAL